MGRSYCKRINQFTKYSEVLLPNKCEHNLFHNLVRKVRKSRREASPESEEDDDNDDAEIYAADEV